MTLNSSFTGALCCARLCGPCWVVDDRYGLTVDASWTAVVVAIVVGVATLIPLYKPTPAARVQYIVKPAQTLVNIPAGVEASVSIGGVPVTNAFSLEVRIANSGRTSFTTGDWDSRLAIQLPSTTRILSARQIGASPAKLRVKIHQFDEHLEIDPYLMNPRDLVAIQLVCEGTLRTVAVHARILTLQSVKRRRIPYNPGMGPDGEVQSRIEVIPIFVLPIVSGLFLAYVGFQVQPATLFDHLVFASISFFAFCVLEPLFMRSRIMVSRLWRPVERIDP
jgi:hypothetical protein